MNFHCAGSSLLEISPGEGTEPTGAVECRDIPVGRVPSRGALRFYQRVGRDTPWGKHGFGLPDLIVILGILALLVAIAGAALTRSKARARQSLCERNVKEVTRAILSYAEEHRRTLPSMENPPPLGVRWFYKELVKGYLGLTGPSSPKDTVFACPDDRGYTDPGPFHASSKYYYGSYVFNGDELLELPSLIGKSLDAIRDPARTLLLLEWTARAPLSWHTSKTGKRKYPFYNDAENMVGFLDGHVKYIKIYYDGVNPAYTRDPIPGYEYKYSAE